MKIEDVTARDIERMDYNELIGLTKETNRIPGGRSTVFEIVSRVCVDRETKVLEIGTSTGFTALELSKLVPCKLTSIDINELSLEEARVRAREEGFDNIRFVNADVNCLPFEDGEFDLVIVGNVLSLMSNKEQAFKECRRVCRKNGFIVSVPMYYVDKPSEDLVRNVSEAIQVEITPQYKPDWNRFFEIPGLEVYHSDDYRFDFIDDEKIDGFVDLILARDHLQTMAKSALDVLETKYREHMFLFRDNLSKMGFTIMILSNESLWEDPELYTSTKVRNDGTGQI